MASIEVKNINSPDETRPFAEKGHADVLNVGDHVVLYGTFEPGWRWSEHVKPISGTDTLRGHAPPLLRPGTHGDRPQRRERGRNRPGRRRRHRA